MTAIVEVRTPQLIAVEIRSIDVQTRQIVLRSAIDIGNKLIEAKALVSHGEWGTWLTDNVNYGRTTANNFMRVAEEYGSNFQALENLDYTQAVALLAVPAEDREQFATDVDAENMSTRELQAAIKDKQAAEQRFENAKKIAETERKAREKLAADIDKMKRESAIKAAEVSRLQIELADAKIAGDYDAAQKLKTELTDAQAKVLQLEAELIAKPIDVPAIVEKIPEAIEAELAQLRNAQKSSKQAAKFSAGWELVNKGFNDVLSALGEIHDADPEAYEKYRAAVTGMIGKMSERLGAGE